MHMLKRLSVWGLLAALMLGVFVPVMAQDSEETLTIAVIGASSGSRAANDRVLYQAAVLAATDLNNLTDDDEIVDADDTRYRFEVAYYEADNDSEVLDAYEDAVDDDVVAVILSSAGGVTALDNNGTLTVPIFHTVPDGVTGNGFYRLVPSYTVQAETIADYLVNQRYVTEIAVAAADTATAQSARDTFVAQARANGAEIVVNTTHEADATDLTGEAKEIRKASVDALLLWTLDTPALRLLEALNAEGWNGIIVYNNLTPNFIDRAGDLAEGVIAPLNWLENAYDAQSAVFTADYIAEWETSPSSAAAAYYDAVRLVGEAVREAGGAPAAIRTELNTFGEYDGVQAVYTNAQSDDLLLAQRVNGVTLEQVRYRQGECVNCPGYWRADLNDATVERRDTLLIGLLVPTSGLAEANGIAIENAVEMAVREVNDLGGIVTADDVQYTLVTRTYSANDPLEAAAALQQAAEEGAVAVFGLDFNAQVLANLPLLGTLPTVQFVSATDGRIPVLERTDSTLQIRSNDVAVADRAIRYLIDELELTEIATVAVRTDYAREAQHAAEEALKASDEGRLTLAANYTLGNGNFTDIATRITNSGTESVIIWAPTHDALRLLGELELLAWDGVFIYPYLTPATLADFQAETVRVLGVSNWWASATDWRSITFSNAYAEDYGEAPIPQAASYYDAVHWFAAQVSADGVDAAVLNDSLLDTALFNGVQGEYRPADYGSGETVRSVFIGEVTADSLVEIARYDGETCLIGCE
jgi:branched-chain amino acid transport system substrate-binding protein